MVEPVTTEVVLKGLNITIVYERLPLATVSRDALLRIAAEPPALVDVPNELISAVFPSEGIQLTLANRRLMMSLPEKMATAERCAAAGAMVHRAMAAVEERLPTVAFGFNYDLEIRLSGIEAVGRYLRDRFIAQRRAIETAAGAPLVGTGLQLSFDSGEQQRNVNLRPSGEDAALLVVHVNVHFPSRPIPAGEALGHEFWIQYQEARQVVDRLVLAPR